MRFEDYAKDGSKGARRAKRQDVRNALGTSSDPAPTVEQALLAANALQGLLDLASNGRFGLAVVDLHKVGKGQDDEIVYISSALAHVRRRKDDGATTIGPYVPGHEYQANTRAVQYARA